MNGKRLKMPGYAREEMIGLHASDIVAETERPHINSALREIQEQSGYFRVWQFGRKDGSIFDAEVFVSAHIRLQGYRTQKNQLWINERHRLAGLWILTRPAPGL